MTSTEMKNINIQYDEFAFEISGIAENRIWDPDGSASSNNNSIISHQNQIIFMSNYIECCILAYDMYKNEKH